MSTPHFFGFMVNEVFGGEASMPLLFSSLSILQISNFSSIRAYKNI
jgi:hypothetical protein